ncbi:EAL domain-containing protein [Micromonospora sp. M12]
MSRAELIADLRRAVDEEQLHLEFQPIVDLATGAVRSAEALVRWRHPDWGCCRRRSSCRWPRRPG